MNHPLNSYKPTNFKWKGQGGQSKVLGFYSVSRKKDLVVKIYPALYYADAQNEFNNMNVLMHDNILQVYEMHTIFVGDPTKEQNMISDDSDSGIDLSGSDSDKAEKVKKEKKKQTKNDSDEEDIEELLDEGAQHADIMIIMEKADKTLSKVISNRKAANQPFSSAEHLEFWRKIINVFAFCTAFKISHNDIKPSNILLVRNQSDGKKSGVEGDINETYTPKIADFGTSVASEQDGTANVRLLNADSMVTNNQVAMTPLYASPNVVQNAPKLNKFMEDVFSLGMTFL